MSLTPGAAPNLFIHTTLESWPWQGGALAMHLGRLVSVLAGLGLTAATYALGRRIWPARPAAVPLAAAAFVAFLPESLFVGGAMSNDMLAAMWSALALWMAASAGVGASLAAGLFLGLGVLTKASTGFLAPVIAAALLAGSWPRAWAGHSPARPARPGRGDGFRRSWRAIGRAALAGAAALAVAAPWLWRNWRLYGDPLGWPLVLATIDRRQGALSLADLWGLARGWFLSFWGKFGGAGHIPLPALHYVLWGALIVAAAAGWLMRLRSRSSPGTPAGADADFREGTKPGRAVGRSATRGSRPVAWLILLGGPAMAVLAILVYSRVALGTDQGRLLFPGLAPAALLLAGGLAGWLPEQTSKPPDNAIPDRRGWRGQKWLPLGVAIGMAAMAVWALAAGIIAPFAPPPAATADELAAATPLGQVFGEDMELIAARWDKPSGAAAGSDVTLTLYWRLTKIPDRGRKPVPDDLRTVVRLTDAEGNLLWESKRSPGAGRFSTDRWPADRPVADVYRLPAEALTRAVRVEVGVQPFPEKDWLAPAGGPRGEQLLTLPKPAALP